MAQILVFWAEAGVGVILATLEHMWRETLSQNTKS